MIELYPILQQHPILKSLRETTIRMISKDNVFHIERKYIILTISR